MITQLYTFSPGSFVVADEWNANFRTLYNASLEQKQSISDANSVVAFPTSDLSAVFLSVKNWPNSSSISGPTVVVAPEQEYYKTLSNGENLTINIPVGLNAEARVLIQLQENRNLLPFNVNYTGGTLIVNHYDNFVFWSGYYYIMIYESNGVAQVKLIWTGV